MDWIGQFWTIPAPEESEHLFNESLAPPRVVFECFRGTSILDAICLADIVAPMLSPPSLRSAPYYPVTSCIGVAAIALTFLKYSGQLPEEFVMNNLVWEKWQIWRGVTSTLPHVNILHLAFNLYWFWTFGALVERVFGHLRCAAIFVLFAVGSMLADYAVSLGGIGLSGVGYGLWGMIWVLEKKDDRFLDAVDEPTSRMFIGWFFVCILLTVTNIMPVANVAHGVGAVMGVLLGFAISGRRQIQRESIAGLAIILLFSILASTVYWPAVNFSADAKEHVEDAGLMALEKNDSAQGVKLLERAAHLRHAPARMWYNLGIAYRETGRYKDAIAAFNHAAGMPDADESMRDAANEMNNFATPAVTNRMQ
jgi:membrane associated rhomboid family serine protease